MSRSHRPRPRPYHLLEQDSLADLAVRTLTAPDAAPEHVQGAKDRLALAGSVDLGRLDRRQLRELVSSLRVAHGLAPIDPPIELGALDVGLGDVPPEQR